MERIRERINIFLQGQLEKFGKNGFLVCMSGGLDSATVLKLAVDAVGKEKVTALICDIDAISDSNDLTDGKRFCEALGISVTDIHMTELFESFRKIFPKFHKIIHRNNMTRLRSVLAYTLADQYDLLVIGTSNKSESLLQGFLHFTNAADVFPISDLYKTEVKEIAKHIGVPDYIVNKDPNDSIKNGVKDKDLYFGYDYDVIDPLLRAILDHDLEKLNQFEDKKLMHLLCYLVRRNGHDVEFPEFVV